MAVLTVPIAPQDELLRLTGTTGDPFEDVTTTGNGTGKYYGANQQFIARAMVAGTVSGTNPTLDVKFQDSADNVTYADMGIAFDQIIASNAAATGSLTAVPARTVRTVSGRPWVRVVKTIGGTATPTFNDFAVLTETAIGF